MKALNVLYARLRAIVKRDAVLEDIEEELRSHVEMATETNVARGMSPEEARAAAVRSFGNLARLRELAYEVRGGGMLETLWQDVRFGLRMMARKPVFTLVAVITLMLGIGANTAIFSVVNAVLLRPLPYPESDRLVFVSERSPRSERLFISWPNYQDWRAQNRVFEYIGVYNRDSYNLSGGGEPERLLAGQVSADLFAALRVNASLGRVFTLEEDQPGAAPVVVLSDALWQRRFGGDRNIVEQTITLNDRPYTVIGVMPADFQFPARTEIWVPAGQLSGRDWRNRDNHPALYGVARLKPGVTVEQARADMDSVAANLEEQNPRTNRDHRVAVLPLLDTVVGEVRRALWVLFAAAGFVVAIACANVANLLLVRGAVRRREMAIRGALGAARARLIRQLLTESVMLALAGGALGCLLAHWGLKAFVGIGAGSLPRNNEIGLDWRVLAFTAGVSVLTGVFFGLAPAFRASGVSLQQSLKEAGHNLIAGKQRMLGALVVTEIALALMLLIGAGLLLRSFYRINNVDAGFVYDRLLSFSISLPAAKYRSVEQRLEFYGALLEKLRAQPGAQSVSLASGLPFGSSSWRTPFVAEGTSAAQTETPMLEACLISPDYFQTMQIPLKSGRYFTDLDNRSHLAGRDLSGMDDGAQQALGLNTIIVDEEFARRYWPDADAVGKQIRLAPVSPGSPVLTIAGVVGRVKMDRLSAESNRVQAYFSYLQSPFPNMSVVIRSEADPDRAIAAARQTVQSLDPLQPIYNIRTLEQVRSDSIASERLNLTLLGLFSALALVLAAVGVYGVMSYSVTQRTREIGVRLALGANPGDVQRLVIGQGMKLALIGLLLGWGGAIGLTRLLASLLFGVSATDPLTFVMVTIVLAVAALAACYIPARRAMRVDPLTTLRYE